MYSASGNCGQILATVVVDEWHNSGPQDLVTLSLCIQCASIKCALCSLCKTYASSYHNPTTTTGRSVHWHQQTTHPQDIAHTVCHLPWTVKKNKNRFIHEEHLSNTPDAIECERLPAQTATSMDCSQGETLMRMTSMSVLQSACQLHASSKLATSVASCCVIKLHPDWLFTVGKLILYSCHLISILLCHTCEVLWQIPAMEKCSVTQIYTDLWTIFERNRSFVHLENALGLWV